MTSRKPSETVDLSIVMVTFNVRELTENSLCNLQETIQGINYEVICVDNNSRDGTTEMIETGFPWVKLIKNSDNKGIAIANNQGIRISNGRYIALYNPDTLAVGNAFEAMVRFLDGRLDVAALGPQLLNEDGTVQISARYGYINIWNEFCFHSGLYRFFSQSNLFGRYYKGISDVRSVQAVDQVITACMVVRSVHLASIDGMDENFFLYGDDVDLNKRLRDKGLKILYYPKAKIYHLKGRSSKQFREFVQARMLDSHNYFIEKHSGRTQAALHRLLIEMVALSWICMCVCVKVLIPWKMDRVRYRSIMEKFTAMLRWSLGNGR